MTADDSHANLITVWERVYDAMDGLPHLLEWGDVQYMDVTDMADRVRGLATHLASAVELTDKFRYDSALALLRTGLEHTIVDWLVFHGRTLVQRYSGVDDEQWQEWKAARAAGAEWTTTIRDWTRTRRGDVRVVREGLYSEPDEAGNRQQLSIYYFLLEQYRPTLGPPSAQTGDWAISRDELRRMADENQAIWQAYLKWSSLIENLKENELVDEVDAGRLTAHYRFLSGYAHPVVDHRRKTYGQHALLGWPRYDHYCSELILLYALTLGTLELENFVSSLQQRAAPGLANADDVEQVLEASKSATSHFWFLGTNPHQYDKWKARNEDAFRAIRDGVTGELLPEPTPDETPYPTDPLQRLIAMHSNAQEMMTGLTYASPWPRNDAHVR
jgi:hypothetical protein